MVEITKRTGKGWILGNLSISHLDYYYAFCTVLSFLNLVFFLVVAKLFVYNTETSDKEMELQAKENRHSNSTHEVDKSLDDRASTEAILN